jgi:glycosyltransferase involved in cell wall biosynthesis
MKVVAVVPAYKEEGRIGAVVQALASRVDSVIVVDDGSGDATAREAAAAGAVVLTHSLNRGQGAALRTGVEAALVGGADVVVHIDADGQHDPDAIPALVAPVMSGSADIVFGSRFLGISAEGMPASRRALLWAARQFSALVLGIPRTFTDPQSGLRAMSAAAARAIDFKQDRMAHCSEILRLTARSGLRATEVPVRVRYTADTLAKGQKATDAFKIVWQLLLGSFNR